MMKQLRKYMLLRIGLLAGLLVGLGACESDVVFEGEQTAPQLVMNAVVTANSSPKVYLSESRFFLDDKTEYTDIKDASVSLYVDGVFVEELVLVEEKDIYGNLLGSCYYKGSELLRSGSLVEFRASCERLGARAKGSTTIPAVPVVEDMRVSCRLNESNYVEGIIQLPLNDPKEQTNYYWLSAGLFTSYSGEVFRTPVKYVDKVFMGGRMSDVLDDILGETPIDGTHVFFSDEYFNGYKSPLWMEFLMHPEYVPYSEVWCELYQIDQHLFRYLLSVEMAEEGTSFGEPVQIYSNVEGGMGLVGSRAVGTKQSISCSELINLPDKKE